MKHHLKLLALALLGLMSTASQAALVDRGNGLVYDSDLNITWLKDANLAQTSLYDADGRMSWTAANAWAEQLNFAGFSDWRLPGLTNSNICVGSQCSNSELAHLFYGELGGQAEADLATQHNANYALFSNVQSSVYWLRDSLAIAPGYALGWGFVTGGGVLAGYQNLYNQGSEFHAWAVHAGDIGFNSELPPSNVPLPGALWLFTGGLAGLLAGRKRVTGQR